MVHRLKTKFTNCYYIFLQFLVFKSFLRTTVFCNYPDYWNFNEHQYKKNYANQEELFPCPKLYEYCGDSGSCCKGLQCTDATFEQDTKDYVFERFFCGNASKSYNDNLIGLREFIQKFERDGFI